MQRIPRAAPRINAPLHIYLHQIYCTLALSLEGWMHMPGFLNQENEQQLFNPAWIDSAPGMRVFNHVTDCSHLLWCDHSVAQPVGEQVCQAQSMWSPATDHIHQQCHRWDQAEESSYFIAITSSFSHKKIHITWMNKHMWSILSFKDLYNHISTCPVITFMN